MGATKAVQKPHWYFQSIWHCPHCGKTTIYRERKYGPKPEERDERYEYEEDTLCATNDVAWG